MRQAETAVERNADDWLVKAAGPRQLH
jgi:hypothetical protein